MVIRNKDITFQWHPIGLSPDLTALQNAWYGIWGDLQNCLSSNLLYRDTRRENFLWLYKMVTNVYSKHVRNEFSIHYSPLVPVGLLYVTYHYLTIIYNSYRLSCKCMADKRSVSRPGTDMLLSKSPFFSGIE